MFLNEKYDVVFNFYSHSEKFLFCKKTNLLEELEKELKKMGEKINKKFNESYCINPDDEHRYVFEFCLQEQHFLHIKIKRDNEYLELAKQSTGFQWFFNLFLIFYINTIIITKEFLLIMVSALWLWTSQLPT